MYLKASNSLMQAVGITELPVFACVRGGGGLWKDSVSIMGLPDPDTLCKN